MIPRLNTRLALFEVTLFLVVAALGWATFRTYTALNDFHRRPVPTPAAPPVEEILQPAPALLPVPLPVPTTVTVVQPPQDIQQILTLTALLDVKNRYIDLAEQLEPGLAELRDALQSFLRTRDRAEIGRYRRKSQALESWLRKQQENLDQRKQQTLREWLASLPPTNTTPVAVNLDLLLHRAQSTLSNYLATVPLIEGQPLPPDLVQSKLVRAAEPEQELLALGRQSREQAGAIDAFVQQRQAASTSPPPSIQVTASAPATVSAPAPPPQPVVRLVRPVGDGGAAAVAAFAALVSDVRAAFQPLFYVLAGTLLVQCLLLIVALYNRIVVAPLRQKLIEDNTAVEHQKKLTHFARLATSLAHEIRNPLTAISVRLFTLQKATAKASSEHHDATLIRNEIDRLEQILKNFLKLARPSEPKLTPLTAEPALREVRDLFAPQLQRQAIELKTESLTSASFLADPLQLKQVLINLIQNAADSIGRKGAVTLRARDGETRVSGRRVKTVILEVEDTGGGMPPEVQENLFDPFFSTKENGTGLGLPIAAKIIDQHHGTLDFETRLGEGTTFRVMLPAANP
jgi:signal transduction histidine kinase